MWRNIVEPSRPQMTIWPMRIAFRIPKATNTHSEYAILAVFPLRQCLHESASVLSYACIVYLVYFCNSRIFWLTTCITWRLKSWYPFSPVPTKTAWPLRARDNGRFSVRVLCVHCLKYIISDVHEVSGDCAASVFIGLLVIVLTDLLNYCFILRSVATLVGSTRGHFNL